MLKHHDAEKIQKSFPWFLRLHDLLGSSPTFDCSGVVNSMTSLNLSILAPREDNEISDGQRDEEEEPQVFLAPILSLHN